MSMQERDIMECLGTLPTYSQLAAEVRRQSRSVTNRFRSIITDAQFAREVRKELGWPVFTNSRGGDWYYNPKWDGYAGKCQFKSTDGHNGNWGFSKRRLGLNVLKAFRDGRPGVIILDTTRRGKSFPDAFTKTIPIWISVMNSHFFPGHDSAFLPHPRLVSNQEKYHIERLLPRFLQDLKDMKIDLADYVPPHPLRVIWANRDTDLESLAEGLESEMNKWCTLVLVMVSEVVPGDGIEGEYIQGAADDAENWLGKSGLTHEIFWESHDELMRACAEGEEHLLAILDEKVKQAACCHAGKTGDIEALKPTTSVFVTSSKPPADFIDEDSVVIDLTGQSTATSDTESRKNTLSYKLFQGKKGAKHLREVLPCIRSRVFEKERWMAKKILFILPPEDADGVAAACAIFVLTLFFDEEGRAKAQDQLGLDVDKQTVQRRIAWWVLSHGESNISRSSLQSVNSVLMDYR
ncbi:initiator tRNA phosphoribosyl transferase [Ascobolus immersus RN42]|uniref:Initiator tRNA phosphoribosyl transferase n=1 Tax=Ascobolus immersus RN42 TaxID=1160509 RepID=A0A3N4J0D7_ASCIM|nr:initiator tRNA phosphoribosyl transferase [Ascobolus immersus RN42]